MVSLNIPLKSFIFNSFWKIDFIVEFIVGVTPPVLKTFLLNTKIQFKKATMEIKSLSIGILPTNV